MSGKQFCYFIVSAYEEMLHWRPIANVFMIPFGKAGKSFMPEGACQVILIF